MNLSRRRVLYCGGCAVAGAYLSISPTISRLLDRSAGAATAAEPFVPPDSIPIKQRAAQLAYLAPFVEKDAKWDASALFKFLNAMTSTHLKPVGTSLAIKDFDKKDKPAQIAAIHREILWQSSSVLMYPSRSIENIDYHGIVVWCSSKMGISEDEARFTSTFDLEQQILKNQFVLIWDKLSVERRQKLISAMDPTGLISNTPAITAMTGAAALTALSTTVYFTGFAFYTSMAVILCTVAGWVGVTLPFAAFMTASSTVAVLAGPIGWAFGVMLLAGAIAAWAGQADIRKTTATVMQLHCMKAGALYGIGQL